MKLEPPAVAIVRVPSARYAECLRSGAGDAPNVGRARAQHQAYVAALERRGASIAWVTPNDDFPDGCFVEDTAVVVGARAVLTQPGATSRQGEVHDVRAVLERHCEVHPMRGAARLDGGDVLRVGRVLFVGLSARTNTCGAKFLEHVATEDGLEVRTAPVPAGLHLKSACTLLDEGTIVCDAELDASVVDVLRTSGCEIVRVPEQAGSNVLVLGDVVLVSSAAPATVELLRQRGKAVEVLELGEIHAADGALTCLSIRIPRPGAWSV